MTEGADQSPHNLELQSLRGIAALVVMAHHSLRTLRYNGWAWIVSEKVLNAHGAVVVFFVLSGFVLSKSLARRGLDRYGLATFYIRRGFRIYPALWIGSILGVFYMLLSIPLSACHLSDWMLGHYDLRRVDLLAVFGSVIGATNFLLPTSWTITVELCASLVLPAMVWAFLSHPRAALPIILGFALLSLGTGLALRQVPFYMVDFALGSALACLPAMRKLDLNKGAVLLAILVLLFAQLFLPWANYAWFLSMIEGVASMVIVAGLIRFDIPWLRRRSLVTIGDWSYSIYLLHLPIAFVVARSMDHFGLIVEDRNVAALAIGLVTAILTIPLSAAVYRYIEMTGIAAGTTVLRQWETRRHRVPGEASSEA